VHIHSWIKTIRNFSKHDLRQEIEGKKIISKADRLTQMMKKYITPWGIEPTDPPCLLM
jgi:hypothetical protein